jgi:hypothetical protein
MDAAVQLQSCIAVFLCAVHVASVKELIAYKKVSTESFKYGVLRLNAQSDSITITSWKNESQH